MWTTRLDWNGKHWIVSLLCEGIEIAKMTLDEWVALSATKYVVEESRQSAE